MKITSSDDVLLIDLCNTLYRVNTWYEFVKWSGGTNTHRVMNTFFFKLVNLFFEKVFNISLSRCVLALYSRRINKTAVNYNDYVRYLNENYINTDVLDFILSAKSRKIIVSGTDSKISNAIKEYFCFDESIASKVCYDKKFKLFDVNIYKNKTEYVNFDKCIRMSIITDNYADYLFYKYGVNVIAVCNRDRDLSFWKDKKISMIIKSYKND